MDNNQNNMFGGQPANNQPQQTTPYGQQPQQQATPYGQQPQQQATPYGQQPQQQANPYGQQPQQQANPFGQQPQQQANPFGQQPQQQANPYGQQPQQQANPFGQQPQQQAYPFGNQPAQKKPINEMFGIIAMICGAVSLVMAVIGSIFTCTCSASMSSDKGVYSTSQVIAVDIVAAIIAAAAVVLAIIALKKNSKDKFASVAVALGVFSFFYALLPMLTVCGYNCSLREASLNSVKDALKR